MKTEDLKIFLSIPTVETDRLILRKIEGFDRNDVYEYASDPEVSRFLLWYPHKDLRFTEEYLKAVRRCYKKNDFFDWAITLKKNGKMIGTAGFTSFDIENNSAEIGYVLNSAYWGQGIAKEAASAVISFGFRVLSLHRIEAKFMTENERSRRVAQKCGMISEGIMRGAIIAKGEYRDIELYSITEEDYKKRINQ